MNTRIVALVVAIVLLGLADFVAYRITGLPILMVW